MVKLVNNHDPDGPGTSDQIEELETSKREPKCFLTLKDQKCFLEMLSLSIYLTILLSARLVL
jgi:hypothetical protein